MEQQTSIPLKSRMKPRDGQKRAIFPSLIWRGGASRFSIYFVQDSRSLPEAVLVLTLGIQTRHNGSIRLDVHLNIHFFNATITFSLLTLSSCKIICFLM